MSAGKRRVGGKLRKLTDKERAKRAARAERNGKLFGRDKSDFKSFKRNA